MTTPLDKDMKREVDVQGQPFTLTVSPHGFKLVPKGKRNGVELRWSDLVSGDAALSTALNASLDRISKFPGAAPARASTTQASPPQLGSGRKTRLPRPQRLRRNTSAISARRKPRTSGRSRK